MQIQEILIVRDGSVSFGIPTYWIGQILRVPEITPLALSPAEIHGMCAIGGNITTAIDMNLLLGMRGVDLSAPQSRILTLNETLDASALVVSEVVASVLIDPENIEYLSDPEEPIVAIYHHANELIQIVDIERLVRRIRTPKFDPRGVAEKNGSQGVLSDQNSRYGRYLLFRMGGETYALEIENLREILGSYHPITPLSGSEDEVTGMMSLRDELILIVDLRLHYGFEPLRGEKNRILVVQSGKRVIGLMIDEIIDIKEIVHSRIERFEDTEGKGKIAGVVHDANHLIALIGMETLEAMIQKYDPLIVTSDAAAEKGRTDALFEAVVFRLGDEEYAIDIEKVAEIIDKTPVTPIAQAPDMVEGMVNIRGQIVMIGSLHRRLGIEQSAREDQKIIICETPKGRIGFFVDGVSDVVGVYTDQIRPEEDPRSLFSDILYLEGGARLVLLLDLERFYASKRER